MPKTRTVRCGTATYPSTYPELLRYMLSHQPKQLPLAAFYAQPPRRRDILREKSSSENIKA
ncbi:hypothetical protein LMG33818_002057 [Halomonadaceae bacterium LMG 33818]